MAWLVIIVLAFAISRGPLGTAGAILFGAASVGTVTVGKLLVSLAIASVTNVSWRIAHLRLLLALSNLIAVGLFVGIAWLMRPALGLIAPGMGLALLLFLYWSDRLPDPPPRSTLGPR
jgi:hypothetical protein